MQKVDIEQVTGRIAVDVEMKRLVVVIQTRSRTLENLAKRHGYFGLQGQGQGQWCQLVIVIGVFVLKLTHLILKSDESV